MVISAVGCIGTELGVDVDVPTEVTMLEPMGIKVTLKNELIAMAQDVRDIEVSVESNALKKHLHKICNYYRPTIKNTLLLY